MEDFPNNSFAAREATTIKPQTQAVKQEQTPVTPVVNAKPVVAKKSGVKKVLSDIFVPEDVSDIGQFLWKDIAVPGIKRAMWDTLGMLLGEKRPMNGSSTPLGSGVTKMAYQNMYQSSSTISAKPSPTTNKPAFDYSDLKYDDKGTVLFLQDRVIDYMQEYRVMSVAQFYSMGGLDARDIPWSAENWGWRDLRGMKVVDQMDGYVLRMPRPIPLN